MRGAQVWVSYMTRVLVISSDDRHRSSLHSMLQRAGYTVATVSSPYGAGWRPHATIDAVLIDLQEAHSIGTEAVAATREEFPETPMLALVEPQQGVDFFALRIYGADDVLQHPVTAERLLEAVKSLLLPHEET